MPDKDEDEVTFGDPEEMDPTKFGTGCHHQGGPSHLIGTYRKTDRKLADAADKDQPNGTVARATDGVFWICDGNRQWAGIFYPDNEICGYINSHGGGLTLWERVEFSIVEVQNDDLRVGDVIVDFRHSRNSWNRWAAPRLIKGTNLDGTVWITPGTPVTHKGSPYSFRVKRRVTASTAGIVPVIAGSWNGKCHRCGKGTYTGLFAVEHEGGGCP